MDTFLAFCESKKDIIVLHPNVPVKAWKEISSNLEVMQVVKPWGNCRDKYNQMLLFFKTVLPTKGKMGSSMWPYFATFCSIYEVPTNYHELINEDGSEHAAETSEHFTIIHVPSFLNYY